MLNGDVPDEHKDLVSRLQKQEIEIEQHSVLSKEYVAQSFVCLAHDWYDIGMEEEGHRLLEKAEITCPGYFQKYARKHSLENPNFEYLLSRLFFLIGYNVVQSLKDFKK